MNLRRENNVFRIFTLHNIVWKRKLIIENADLKDLCGNNKTKECQTYIYLVVLSALNWECNFLVWDNPSLHDHTFRLNCTKSRWLNKS